MSVPTPRFNQEVAQHTRTALKDTVRRLEARMNGPIPSGGELRDNLAPLREQASG